MRTDIINANEAMPVTSLAVLVSTGTSWIDLCNPAGSVFPGKSRVRALSLSYNHDTGRWSGNLSVLNHPQFRAANESLDPGHISKYNPDAIPLLGAYHEVRILLGKGGGPPALIFHGYVGPDTTDSGEDVEMEDLLSVNLVGIMQPYFDFYIDKANGLVYSDTYIATPCQHVERDMLNQILRDYGFAETIVIKDDPMFYVYRYQIGDISIGEAIQRPVHSIGYVLMEKWHAATNTFRPTVVDPMRTNFVPDINLRGNIRAVRLAYTEANVRTYVRVVYRDRITGKEAWQDSASEEARIIYGIPDGQGGRKHKYMRIAENEGSLIDTPAEAQREAELALHDVSTPCPGVEVTVPWLVLGIEGGDLVQVETPSETLLVGITEINWTLNGPEDILGATTFRGTLNRRVGARRYWFERSRTDWIGKHDRDRDSMRGPMPYAPSRVEAQGLWGEGESGTPVPVLNVSWSGIRDWRTGGYIVRYCEAKIIDSGIATGGTPTTLVDNSKNWPNHVHRLRYVWLEGPRPGEDEVREILNNTANTLILREPFITSPTAGETYMILEPVGEWYYIRTDKYPYVQIRAAREGVYMLAQVATAPHGFERG